MIFNSQVPLYHTSMWSFISFSFFFFKQPDPAECNDTVHKNCLWPNHKWRKCKYLGIKLPVRYLSVSLVCDSVSWVWCVCNTDG